MSETDSDQDHQANAAPESESEREKNELGGSALYRAVIRGTQAQAERRFVAAKPSDPELYIKRFRRFDEAGGIRPGWHWPALFITIPWLVYRRMYVVAALYAILLWLPGYTEGTDLSNQNVVLIFGLILSTIVPAIFADGVYWWHANRLIWRAQQKFTNPLDQIAWLRKRGGTSSVWLFLLPILVAISFNILDILKEGSIDAFDVQLGDCFSDEGLVVVGEQTEISGVHAVPCEDPHDNEVFAVFDLDRKTFPEGDAMSEIAFDGCLRRFEAFVGRDYQSSSLEIYALYPTQQSWNELNDREVVCALYDVDSKKLQGSMKESGI